MTHLRRQKDLILATHRKRKFPVRLGLSFLLVLAQVQSGVAAIVNDAVATGTYNSVAVTSPISTAMIELAPLAPSMVVTKTATLNDDDGIAGVSAGDTIDYLITVQNAGNVTIDGFVLTDELTQGATTLSLDAAPVKTGGDDLDPGRLNVDETWTYTATYTLEQAVIDAAEPVTNTATGTGNANGAVVESTSTVDVPLDALTALDVTKVATSNTYSTEGETVTWTISVENTGATTLATVDVSDPLADTLVCSISGDATISPLAIGAVETCTATHVVTADDITAGTIDNTATATGTTTGGVTTTGEGTSTVTLEGADLVTVKTLSSGNPTPVPGETVAFLITVTNNGPANATGVTLTDLLPAGLTATAGNGIATVGTYDATSGLWTLGGLPSGASATLTLEGTVDALQTAPVTNTTTPATGDQVDPTTDGDDLVETITPLIIVIDAVDDTVTDPVDSSEDQIAVLNVLDNDLLDTDPATTALVTVTPVGTLPTGITLNADGTVDVAAGTPDGTYTFDYQICEQANSANCDTATVTIPVEAVLPQLSGTVFIDNNSDGTFTDGVDTVQGGYTVQLVLGGVVVGTQITDADGNYLFTQFEPGTYDIYFLDPDGFGVGLIQDVVVADSDIIIDQDLPIDPSGVVYDSVTGAPVAGATLTLTTATGTVLPNACLLPGQQNQVTDANGDYRFDIVAGADPLCPAGETEYRITIAEPAGYLPAPSSIITPEAGALDASTCALDVTPGGSCSLSTSADAPDPAAPTPYFFAFLLASGDPHVVHNHIPLDPVGAIAATGLSITKVANVTVARIGDVVSYTIRVTNNTVTDIGPINVVDQLPRGFAYTPGSATIGGTASEPSVNGRSLTFDNVTVASADSVTIELDARISAAVTAGEYVNTARMVDPATGAQIGETARASVRIEPEHVFDCGEVIGKVFDDQNGNGYQDEGEPGLPGVRVATVKGLLITTDEYGRYSVPCAAIPDADIGSNFTLKLDTRTLPTGYRVTTENPRTVRLTRGKITKLNFGAAISKVIRIDLAADAFGDGNARLSQALIDGIDQFIENSTREATVLRIVYHARREDNELARERLNAVTETVDKKWKRKRNGIDLLVEKIMVKE